MYYLNVRHEGIYVMGVDIWIELSWIFGNSDTMIKKKCHYYVTIEAPEILAEIKFDVIIVCFLVIWNTR